MTLILRICILCLYTRSQALLFLAVVIEVASKKIGSKEINGRTFKKK